MMFSKRIVANIIDVLVCGGAIFIVTIVPLIKEFFLGLGRPSGILAYYYAIGLCIIYLLFIGKDIIGGQSIGKRIAKIKVVDSVGNIPNIIRLFIRNITIFIWPIEAIFILLEKPRIGERITKTRVIEC